MSHSKERREKICLNCNAELFGRYCHVCGQENIEPKESVWGLITHFFNDITHFDGKFFSTTKMLFARPGYLPKEYINGRRARYLHPIRMYIFSSAVFFLIFFSLFHFEDWIKKTSEANKAALEKLPENMEQLQKAALQKAATREDSAELKADLNLLNSLVDTLTRKTGDTLKKPAKSSFTFIGISGKNYKTKAQYDSIQRALPVKKRDGWFRRKIILREIDLNKRYQENPERLQENLLNKFLHSLPYLLFVSLPLYALFLKLLYVRNKKFYYADHGIFLIYLYIFTFIFLLLYFGVEELKNWLGEWVGILEVIMFLYGIYYAYKSMRKFYEQRRMKTILKFLLLNFLAFISIIFLFSLFFVLTVFNV